MNPTVANINLGVAILPYAEQLQAIWKQMTGKDDPDALNGGEPRQMRNGVVRTEGMASNLVAGLFPDTAGTKSP